MKNDSMDLLYVKASTGDKDAESQLFFNYRRLCYAMANDVLEDLNCRTNLWEDIYEFVIELFHFILSVYDPLTSKFLSYTRTTVKRRLKHFILREFENKDITFLSLDSEDEDGKPFIESVPDGNRRTIQDEVGFERITYEMSSPRKKNGKVDRLRARINTMLILGYSQQEICDTLHITRGSLKYNIQRNKDDKELINYKMELK